MLNLEDKELKDFKVGEAFVVLNSKPYHKKDLKISSNKTKSIPYISRTNRNNGVEEVVQKEEHFRINNKNTIVFGAENATFFMQPFPYITGNKIYTINHKKINKFNGLFLQQALNTSIKNCGFSYGQGLTGTRAMRRNILLPIDQNSNPDFEYMEEYSKSIINCKTEKYKQYAQKVLNSIKYKNIETLENKDWKEFFISGENGLFSITSTSSGIDKNKLVFSNNGKIPYITRSDLNNGINLYLENNQIPKYKIDNGNVITIGLDTQTVFYQPYSFFTGQNIQILRHNKLNKYNSLFLIPLIKIQMQKFNWGGNGATLGRLSKTKIMLPVNSKDEPDFEYMEQYMKNITHKKIKQYLDYLKKS